MYENDAIILHSINFGSLVAVLEYPGPFVLLLLIMVTAGLEVKTLYFKKLETV